jgi:ABC-type phosphate transport system substrate-binding protein
MRTGKRPFLVAVLTISLAALFAVGAEAVVGPTTPGYRVICNPDNPLRETDRRFLQDLFLKKVTVWPDGQTARPVDLGPNSPLRRLFTSEILKRPVEAVRSYWQQRIFAGQEVPPPEVGSEDEVVRFVLGQRGSVGYVSNETALRGAKVLMVR